jgi:predicted ABC-type ATPase
MITDPVKRLRMLAGPNGSGKSTLVRRLAKDFSSTGFFQLQRFINADDLLRQLQDGTGASIAGFQLTAPIDQILARIKAGARIPSGHPFFATATIQGSVIRAPTMVCDSYVAAAIADYLREELLTAGLSFSFETVMSHHSKVDFLASARSTGYRTYLYFVATEDAFINEYRVGTRVKEGGHDVPRDKLRERYARSLELVSGALEHAHRAFLFDNSGQEPQLLAELHPDQRFELKVPHGSLPIGSGHTC